MNTFCGFRIETASKIVAVLSMFFGFIGVISKMFELNNDRKMIF